MFELSLLCPQAQVEIVSDALEALEAQSISVEDSDALTETEQPLFGEPGMTPTQIGWRHSTVKALFAHEPLALEAADLLQAQDFFAECRFVGIERSGKVAALFPLGAPEFFNVGGLKRLG